MWGHDIPKMSDTPKLYTLSEAAALIGLTHSTLRKRVLAGQTPYADRTNTSYLLSAETVEAERLRVSGKPNKKAPDTHKRRGNWATVVKVAPRPQRTMAEVIATATTYIEIKADGSRREVQRGSK